MVGAEMLALAKELFPICRSITGDGVRRTLGVIKREVPALQVVEVPSGTPAFDWMVPDEWNIREAWIETPDGRRIADFRDNNLHVVSYSEPIDTVLPLATLQSHLHSLPGQPNAIPYVTSYYRRNWGFCLPDRVRQTLVPGDYRVYIDSTLAPGSLTYGEVRLPGEGSQQVLLWTYVCHPSMANNELSGPAVAVKLAQWLSGRSSRRYSYRIVFAPETIGALVYLSRHLAELQDHVVAGFVLTCLGDERAYSYLESRGGATLADRVAQHVLQHLSPGFRRYRYLDRGSDERQFGFPGIDLPVCSVMRSKYGEYPEYHTSLDDFSVVTAAGLAGGFEALKRCVECLERNETYVTTTLGEPQLGRRGLYPTTGGMAATREVRNTLNLLAYSDGGRDLIAIADVLGCPLQEIAPTADKLVAAGLLRPLDQSASRFVSSRSTAPQ